MTIQITDSENGGVVSDPKYVQKALFSGSNFDGSQGSVKVTCYKINDKYYRILEIIIFMI